ESGETPDLITALADSNGDGSITDEDLNNLKDKIESLADASSYINDAAQSNPENVDLQLQNVIANLAAAVVKISEMQEEDMQALSNYLDGNGPQPSFWSSIEVYFVNAENSVQNILTYSDPNSFYYSIAQSLNQLFSKI
ncbi:MAG: hypothetical protein ACK4YF_01565, partial [Exilispira sp.]